ncbi:hypothetical protein ACJMK2_021542 [Sinanodonta woodiana]|uniref:Uncharacterized protein n=1 Tax=Sinanodonta woodiana TaxID=1069815 RepID=A0ABD3TGC9_SINWO
MMYITIAISLLLIPLRCVQAEEHNNTTDNDHPVPLTESKKFTAGNTMCRWNEECGFHQGKKYSWCYTDYSDNWDYCCTTRCRYLDENYKWCQSGNQWQYCGSDLKKDINGRQCLQNFPCGTHMNEISSDRSYFWCYVDLALNWDFCCAPHSPCQMGSTTYYWCYIEVYKTITFWKPCKP